MNIFYRARNINPFLCVETVDTIYHSYSSTVNHEFCIPETCKKKIRIRGNLFIRLYQHIGHICTASYKAYFSIFKVLYHVEGFRT